jgi:hypothetical protein
MVFTGRSKGARRYVASVRAVLILGAALCMGATLPQSQAQPAKVAQSGGEQKAGDPNQQIADYTFWLTILTGVLAVVGGVQGVLIWRQIRLARDEFNATHRPRLIVRDVSVITDDGFKIQYLIVNAGDAEATIIESWIKCELLAPYETPRNLMSAEHDDIGHVRLTTGRPIYFTLSPAKVFVDHMLSPFGAFASRGDERLYFAGALLYRDAAGNQRRSVFRRFYNRGLSQFERLDNPDYEYSD